MSLRWSPLTLLPAALAVSALIAADPPPEKKDEEQPAGVQERVVVSASAAQSTVQDAPAAVTILDGEDLEELPGDVLVDHLRRVPGVNVVQFSSRDVNIASRSASGGINSSTLALADGRSLYLDFLGFVMWEFAPTDFSLVEQVEIVRGPASVRWGANATGGVVHVMTKSPRDTLGGKLAIEAGSSDLRRIDFSESLLAGPWALRISAGYREQDAFPRPETIVNVFGETVDPDLGLIENALASATQQPKFDVRADWSDASGATWILQAGAGRSQGWIATGLGPFDIDDGATSAYVQARFLKGPVEAQVVSNYFDGDALNLINEIPFSFRSTATQATLRSRTLIRDRAVFGWGAELNRSTYDLSIAPDGDKRSSAAIFGELDLPLSRRFKLSGGARLDHVRETIGTVFSPRAALRFKPKPNHTLRAAWGRAFRAPSTIESDLFVPAIPVAIIDWQEADAQAGFPLFTPLAEFVCGQTADNCGVPPGEVPDYIAVTTARGSRELKEETTDSFEVGYVGNFGPFGVSATVYRTRSKDGIDFPQKLTYGSGPDGVPGTADDIPFPTDPDGNGVEEAPAIDVCDVVAIFQPFDQLCMQGPVTYNEFLPIFLEQPDVNIPVPALFQYDNSAKTENQGLELGFTWAGTKGISTSLTYSWQDEPRADGVKMSDRIATLREETASGMDVDGDGEIADNSEFVNIPAEHRVSLSTQIDTGRWFAALSYDFVDQTFWQDVLTSDFWGYADSYALVGVRGGWRWADRGLQLTVQVTDLLDEEVQQHIYGDIIGRRASVGLTWRWPGGGSLPESKN